MFITALSLTGNRSRACDLISETYIDILERGKVYPTEDADFLRWVKKYLYLHNLSKYGRYQKQLRGKEQPVNVPNEIEDEEEIIVENNQSFILKLKTIHEGLDSLDLVLFELIYERRLTYSNIISMYNQSGFKIKYHSLKKLAVELKNKIKILKNGE